MITDEVQFPNDKPSILRKIIRVEERGKLPEICKLSRRFNTIDWALITYMDTKSSTFIPLSILESDYERMTGFTSNGKELYIERRIR
jgi:hypothetical protein